MNKKIFQLIPIVVMLIASTGYSYTKKNTNQTNSCRSCEICPPCDPCDPCKPCCTEKPKTGEPCNCAYNAPARIDPACGWDAWVTGSFIFWQPKEKGLDLGYQTTVTAATHTTDYNPINLNTDYHPGFKLGLGMSTETDDWTVYLEYTRLKSDDTTTKDIIATYNVSTNYLDSNWIYNVDGSYHTSYLKGKWELSYNMFDLELGRPYYLGKKLVFNPHFGLRAGWIDQKYNVDSLNIGGEYTTNINVRNKQDTWLVGPRAGVKTNWMLGCDFRLFGNIAGSLTYQKFKSYVNQNWPIQTNITTPAFYKSKNEIGYITPNVEFALGLGYGTYFCNNEWYFDMTVGYDFHYYWNQNFMRHDSDAFVSPCDYDAGNLMLHGLTITARFDF